MGQQILGKIKDVRWPSEPLTASFIHQVILEYLLCVPVCPYQGHWSGRWGWQSIEMHMICHRALRATRDGEVQVTRSYGHDKQMRPLVNCSFRTWKSPCPKSSVQSVHLDSQAGMGCSCRDPQRTWIVKFLQRSWPWWCPKHHPPPHPATIVAPLVLMGEMVCPGNASLVTTLWFLVSRAWGSHPSAWASPSTSWALIRWTHSAWFWVHFMGGYEDGRMHGGWVDKQRR